MRLRLNSRVFIAAGRQPVAVVVVSCLLAFYFVYFATKFKLSMVWPPSLHGDAIGIFELSQRTFMQSAYPTDAIFPYPPSAVLIFRSLEIGGSTAFMSVWYVLMAAGLIVTMRASLVQERREVRSAWLLIGLAGVLLAELPIDWDLRGASSNVIYLGLVMAGYGLLGGWPILAGIMIGTSVSLKLYSGLLLLWLLVNRHGRAFGAAAATALALWILLPAVVFGVHGAIELYIGWLQQLQKTTSVENHLGPSTNLIALQHAVVNLTGAAYGSTAALAGVFLLWAIWLAALLSYVWRCLPYQDRAAAPSRAALADWVVLLLAPLLFSHWLEQPHCVPLLVAALLCVVIALDANVVRRDRTAALVGLAMLASCTLFKAPFAFRGFEMEAEFLVLVLVLAFIRPRLAAKPLADFEPRPMYVVRPI